MGKGGRCVRLTTLSPSCAVVPVTAKNSGNVVGIAVTLRTGGLEARIVVGDFSLFQKSIPGPWPHPALLFGGFRGSFPGVKWAGREV